MSLLSSHWRRTSIWTLFSFFLKINLAYNSARHTQTQHFLMSTPPNTACNRLPSLFCRWTFVGHFAVLLQKTHDNHLPTSVLLADRCEKQKLCYHSCRDAPAAEGISNYAPSPPPQKNILHILDGPLLRWDFFYLGLHSFMIFEGLFPHLEEKENKRKWRPAQI